MSEMYPVLFVIFFTVVDCQSTSNAACTYSSDVTSMDCALQHLQIAVTRQAETIKALELRIGQLEESRDSGYTDCYELLQSGYASSGVYQIRVRQPQQPRSVYCDMTTDGGGWTVFQRRFDGSENFNRSWEEYKQGFGDASGEYWLGNEMLYLMTSQKEFTLRIDLEDFADESRFAVYSLFKVHSEAQKYLLEVGGYSGTAGDTGNGFSYHNGSRFSTYDQDNDALSSDSCVNKYGLGGFWYKACMRFGANSHYSHSSTGYGDHRFDRIYWLPWVGNSYYSLKSTKMMIRPVTE